MHEAVQRLRQAIERAELIRIWGDFDADGQTSTSVLWLGLRALGAVVDYTIPRRSEGSRGLNRAGLERAVVEGVRVLLTCDCGVTDYAEVSFARQAGLDVLISDHHDLGPELPEAVAVLNPKRLSKGHPLTHLPGVGVAYKLIEALSESMSQGAGEQAHQTSASPPPVLPGNLAPHIPGLPSSLLDLVALGIVADVADQRSDTRYLLQRGLAQLRAHPRPGVRALLKLTNTSPASLTADGIGYLIGPRLNAVGRLDDAMLAVQLLTTEDEELAGILAAKVEVLNQERRMLQRSAEEDAFRQLARDPALQRHPVIVLTSPAWHPSILGVVASSVSNRYERPSVLISLPEDAEMGRGSARSIAGVDIHAAITTLHELVEASGGHPMAAGFSIRRQNVAAFREAIDQYVAAHAAVEAPSLEQPEAVLAWGDVSLQLCDDLERLAPFGPGNPRPLLKSQQLQTVRTAPLGNDRRHQMVFFQDQGGHIERAIWWRSVGQVLPDLCDLVYTMQRDTYQGKSRLQVQVVRMEPLGFVEDTPLLGSVFRIVDRRAAPDRAKELHRVVSENGAPNVQIWDDLAGLPDTQAPVPTENVAPESLDQAPLSAERRTRLQLEPRPVLIIWSAPAGPEELTAVLRRTEPQAVVLLTAAMAAPSDGDRPEGVMQKVNGMIRTARQRGDALDDPQVIARMAARIGQREATLRAALEFHRLSAAQDKPGAEQARRKFIYFVQETRSYRSYFQHAAAEAILRMPA